LTIFQIVNSFPINPVLIFSEINYICLPYLLKIMTTIIKRIRSAKTLTDALNKVKPVKCFDAKRHLGKVKWDEDPLEFQKRIRNEWD